MGFISTGFTALKRALAGAVLKKIDTSIGDGLCTISLRLKRNSMEHYVVMACLASGNYQYYPMSAKEFQDLADAMQALSAELHHAITGNHAKADR
jgi:hypothetical protein